MELIVEALVSDPLDEGLFGLVSDEFAVARLMLLIEVTSLGLTKLEQTKCFVLCVRFKRDRPCKSAHLPTERRLCR